MRRRRVILAMLAAGLSLLPANAQPETPAGKWLAEDIFGGGVLDRVQTTIEFTGDGRVAGRGGCNHYFAGVKIEKDRMKFSQAGSTQMACTPAVMNQESKFLGALGTVRSWQIDTPARKLFLRNEKGNVILRFARLP